MPERGLRVFGPGDRLCIGCGYPPDLCICPDDSWDDREEDTEGALEREDAFYEDS